MKADKSFELTMHNIFGTSLMLKEPSNEPGRYIKEMSCPQSSKQKDIEMLHSIVTLLDAALVSLSDTMQKVAPMAQMKVLHQQ